MKMMTKKNSGGFTLVEIIVALGIFVSAVTLAVGSLLSLYNANNRSQSLSSVINSLSFSIENMTRTIRFATNYHCGDTNPSSGHSTPRDCSDGNPSEDAFLAVTDSNNDLIRYRFRNARIERSENSNSNSAYVPITSSEVTITNMKFYVLNTTPASGGNSEQPYVVMVIKGYAGRRPSEESGFSIETVVSQRKLDL
jgi:type II secretory pathway pseudopilin PulG